MMEKISSFSGEYRFLSNFWLAPIEYEGVTYASTEHAFQAAKTVIEAEQDAVREAKTPGQAKQIGKAVTLRENWDGKKYDIMLNIVRAKFTQHPMLAKKLLETNDAMLIEGNRWGDRVWGVSGGVGQNWLGKILMQVRDELRG